MFYKQITDKESLKIRNDIFIKDVVPILAKKGFIKSPFYTSCFGRTGNNGTYIYDMCRLRQCNFLEFVTTKISSRDRYIKIYVNTFALHPKIKEKYSLSEIDVTKYNIYPISTNCMQNTITPTPPNSLKTMDKKRSVEGISSKKVVFLWQFLLKKLYFCGSSTMIK